MRNRVGGVKPPAAGLGFTGPYRYILQMQRISPLQPGSGIGALDAETFEILEGDAAAGIVLLCDHAGNAFPDGYGTLGVAPKDLERHIAYDIGARGVTCRLAAALGAPALLTRYSRLLIDPNRGIDDPTLVMRLSDGAIVPGNRSLPPDEREKRIRRFYEPYHAAIDGVIDQCLAAGRTPVLVSVHSFTQGWKGRARPWHAGVLWDKDDRLAPPLISALRAERGLVIGDNEPYAGHLRGDTMWRHGTKRGLAHAIIEIRQDLVRDARGEAAWADRLARIVRQLLERKDMRDDLMRIQYFGSHSD